MKRTVLFIDVSYLSWRAFYTTGGLMFEGAETGVAFGVLRDIQNQIDLHGADICVMAFDGGGPGLRGQLNSSYKKSRADLTSEEVESRKRLYEQMDRLRREIFPDMGFRNVYRAKGYEADDIIAHYAANLEPHDEGVIVSADNDLLQCITPGVRWHNPASKKTVDFKTFREKWNIDPVDWARVKAIAGCTTDDVAGIKGIGEKTAASWISGKLKAGKKFDAIQQNLSLVAKNLPLVRLPFEGLELPDLRPDEVTESKKMQVQMDLGIRPRRGRRVERKPPTGFIP